MSLIKFVSPSGWDFSQPAMSVVKYGSRGLVGTDRREFLKRASHVFLPYLDSVKFAEDEVPLHLISHGASEAYGSNRNGDAFKEAACRKYKSTFEKFGRVFRNHKNKAERGDPSYGSIKLACYNEDMRRVELLCALYATKEAAERNGGYVADVELEKLATDGEFPVSMACRVPYDVCSYCGNEAKDRSSYCTAEKCAAGGCADNLARLVKVGDDLHHLHVINDHPTWFDISRVFRPADRIAYGVRADYLTKAAESSGTFDLQDYVKMANAATAPVDVILYQSGHHGMWTEKMSSQIKLGYALADLEKFSSPVDASTSRALATADFPIEKLAAFGTYECDTQLSALADRKILLTLKDYARLTGREDHIKSAMQVLPGIYGRMVVDESLSACVERGDCACVDKVATERAAALASSMAADHSLDRDAMMQRTMLSCIRGESSPVVRSFSKSASSDPDGEVLAKSYAMYKLAALWRLAATDPVFPLTAKLSVCQNRVFQ